MLGKKEHDKDKNNDYSPLPSLRGPGNVAWFQG